MFNVSSSLSTETGRAQQFAQALEAAKADTARLVTLLEILALCNAETRFAGAAMTLCNELATRLRCERVSLGWVRGGYVRLAAMSHTEKFDRKMALATSLEQAMDEALDQDEEILWPEPAGSRAVARDHEALAVAERSGAVLSLPIRHEDRGGGVLTLERAADGFSQPELNLLRLLCDQTAWRLHEMHNRDRWFGARWALAAREKAGHLLGPQHTTAKLVALGLVLLLGVLLFGRVEHRVEASFTLRCEVLAQVPAPFDGYLDEVHFRVGDPVKAGALLLNLDPRDLLLQEAAAAAEQHRFFAEAQKAEGEGHTAEMIIAKASAAEAGARLELARHRLAQARVVAPFDGHVVEGDLRERLSAPVKQGEVLVKVAKLDAMFAEVAMPERDVHEVHAGQSGEMAFASRPHFSIPIRVERVESAAEVREKEGNVFVVRAEFAGPAESWWRPGMSGVCKVNAGKRNLFWIFTHRSMDWLRLHLWW